MPWCRNRASSPTCSVTLVRKAITSCFTSRSISSMRAGSKFPRSRMAVAASVGMNPSAAIASAATVSISSQMPKRFCASQMAVMAERL